MKTKLLAVVLTALLLPSFCISSTQLTEKKILSSVGRLRLTDDDRDGEGSCSCFKLANSNLIITAAHCAEDSFHLQLQFAKSISDNMYDYGDSGVPLRVVVKDELNDIAILTGDKLKYYQGLSLALREAQLGEKVFLLGFPFTNNHPQDDVSLTLFVGFKAGVFKDGEQKFDLTIMMGDSGGPIVNQSGEVVGIGIADYQIPGQYGYITVSPRIQQIKKLINEAKAKL